jgi:hypothetical protein
VVPPQDRSGTWVGDRAEGFQTDTRRETACDFCHGLATEDPEQWYWDSENADSDWRQAESTLTDPIGSLTDCHRRIELFLAVLEQLSAQARGGPLSREEREALETALRYFREGTPKHTADEEENAVPASAVDRAA